MKRLLSVCLLILCLSFPVFGGHTVAGGYGAYYCECDNPQQHELLGLTVQDETEINQESTPRGEVS
jgi:hypothetical protein